MRLLKRIVLSIIVAVGAGCSLPELTPPLPPTEELFIAMPRGLPTECGPAVREAVVRYIESAPSGTPLCFFLAENQELIAATTVPEGSASFRRKRVSLDLAKVFERLDPEKTGGSQAVDLLSISSSVRKYRKRSDLRPRVVLIGSPLVEDREQGISITKETLPCDGCVTDPATSYGKMPTFPEGTTVSWLTPRADYGNGPNHREQVEHFLRYLMQEKRGPLTRLSSDAAVVFGAAENQWDGEVAPADDCRGAKEVNVDPVQAQVFDNDGQTPVVAFTPTLAVRVQPPKVDLIKGDKRRVLFLLDVSGSVLEDADGNDQSHVLNSIVEDACHKIKTMGFERFAVCGFGGWKDLSPRLPRHPYSMLGGFQWADATPESRDRGAAFVRGLVAGGGTPTLAAVQQALELEGPVTCLLYTDGVPTIGAGGQTRVLEVAKTLAAAGVSVNPIGVGALSAENDEFDWTGGDYFVLSKPESDE